MDALCISCLLDAVCLETPRGSNVAPDFELCMRPAYLAEPAKFLFDAEEFK